MIDAEIPTHLLNKEACKTEYIDSKSLDESSS